MEEYIANLKEIVGRMDERLISPLVLAYIGDACFELYIRSRVAAGNMQLPPERLHRLTVNRVKASSQSDIIHGIWHCLDQEEKMVVKRGRNAKSGTSPRNADITQYRYATGFEALIGHLFIKGDVQRLMGILDMSYRFIGFETK